MWQSVNFLPNYKFLDWSRLKAFAVDTNKIAENLEYVLKKARKHCGKRRKNAGFQHFLLVPQCFQKTSFPMSLKVQIVWLRVNPFPNNALFSGVYSSSPL